MFVQEIEWRLMEVDNGLDICTRSSTFETRKLVALWTVLCIAYEILLGTFVNNHNAGVITTAIRCCL